MRSPTTRPRGDATLSSRLGRADDNTDLLARRITEQNEQRASSGGGAMQGFTRAQSGNSYIKPSGSELYFENYELDTGWNAGPGEAPALVAPPGSWIGVEEEGWYAGRGYFSAVIATIDRVRLKWNTNGDHQGGAVEMYQTVMKFVTRFEASIWFGPVWLPAADPDFTYPIGVIAEWDTAVTNPTLGTCGATFDIWRVG